MFSIGKLSQSIKKYQASKPHEGGVFGLPGVSPGYYLLTDFYV